MFTNRKPWESRYAHMTAREIQDVYDKAEAEGDWQTLSELGRPFVEGEPPAGFGYREQVDFKDRR